MIYRESQNLSCQTSFSSEPSVFRESPLSPSEIANYLRDELKRLRKRRQLAEPYPTTRSPPASPGSPEPMMSDSNPHSLAVQAGPSSPKSLNSAKNSKGDRPVFTLKQMTMICEKMCKVSDFRRFLVLWTVFVYFWRLLKSDSWHHFLI